MKARKNKDSFWLSYSDLMTSLFFIMLVLFVVCTAKMSGLASLPTDVRELRQELSEIKKEKSKLESQNTQLTQKVTQQQAILDGYQATKEQYDRIVEIQSMFESLTEGKTLEYRTKQRTFVARAFEDKEIFVPSLPEFNFKNLSKQEIIQVGKDLEDILKELNRRNPDCSYQLVIEGTTANYYDNPVSKDAKWPYKLSYERALALYNLWNTNGINLRKYNTEILICGSGMNGVNRDKAKEDNNKRIVIQIIPKFNRI
jgi:outer membrane protein OmpA-like peptidoglycan-associated protein